MSQNYAKAEKKGKEKQMRTTFREFIRKEPVPKVAKIRFQSAGKRPNTRNTAFDEKFEKNNKNLKIGVTSFPKKPAKLGSLGTDLQQIRFLTGDRLQPMFKNEFRMKSLPRGSSKEEKVQKPMIHERTTSQQPILSDNLVNPNEKVKNIGKTITEFENLVETIQPESKPDVYDENIEAMLLKHHRESAATKVQKYYKGYKARKAFKSLKEKRLQTSQKQTILVLKEFDSIKPQPSQLMAEKPSDIKIPYELETIPEIPDNFSPYNEKKINPLVSTQSLFRSYISQKGYKNFKNLFQAATKIQKQFRCYQVYKIYKGIKEAIICIQAFYRGYIVRKNLKNN